MWVYLLGIGCALCAGFLLRYWVQARRFDRRSPFGIEQFNGYSDLWTSRLVETLASLISSLMLAAGLGFVMLIAARYLLPGIQ
jgi:hypothetical protein